MKLRLDPDRALHLRSWPQKIRIMTEHWLAENAYCPACGLSSLNRYPNNQPAADFFCACREDFELKSKHGPRGGKIPDGAYGTMIDRIGGARNPNFFFLRYDRPRLEVTDLDIIPKHFFVPAIIESRPPLGPNARRKGWVGCNILIDSIPDSGRIAIVSNGQLIPKSNVLDAWKKTLFLRTRSQAQSRSWLLDVMRYIERLNKPAFTLTELYGSSQELAERYPGNRHVRAKIRQQLQVLRDASYLEFQGRGVYRLR